MLKFSKRNRLVTTKDYDRLFVKGKRLNNLYLYVIFLENEFDYPRLGLRISKKHVKLATERNRIKRIIREHFRLNQKRLNHFDIVVIAKSGIDSLKNDDVRNYLDELWKDL